MLAQCPQFTSGQGMRARRAILHPANVEGGGFEVDLLPTKVRDFSRSQPMPECQQDHSGIAMALAIGLCCLNQLLNFLRC